MLRLLRIKSKSLAAPQTGSSPGQRSIDALYERELQVNMVALQERRRKNRRRRSIHDWVGFWPLVVGVVLSSFTLQLHHLVEPYRPWGEWVVFPFAALLKSTETNLKGDLAYTLPLVFMYLQFPLEGLFATFGLKRHVTLPRFLGQVLFLHVFAVLELWLASGPFGR